MLNETLESSMLCSVLMRVVRGFLFVGVFFAGKSINLFYHKLSHL